MSAPLRILSLGAGVQSTTLLVLAANGELDVDAVVFADTGWEPRAVYAHLWKLAETYGDQVPIVVDSAGDLRADALREGRAVSLPVFTKRSDGTEGRTLRQCTHEYKTAVVRRVARRLGGGPNRADRPVTMLLGISWDEIQRMKPSDVAYVTVEWPLIDLRWRRGDCLAYLAKHQWSAPRSACVGCPAHGDAHWRRIPDDELDDSEAFERELQATTALVQVPYLHRSLRPIREVVDLLRAQGDLFDYDEADECGGGCFT